MLDAVATADRKPGSMPGKKQSCPAKKSPGTSVSGLSFAVSHGSLNQGCQMAKFDPFPSLDCARVEGVGLQSKERKGSNFAV